MDQEDKEKTAFCTSVGLYEFNVMSFGLCTCNGPATLKVNGFVVGGYPME